MALKRIWTPSGNYSGGGQKDLLVIHSMEGFTGSNGAKDCAIYFQSDCGASSQVCIDNNRGTIWECVNRANGAWTQCGYNNKSISVEQSGYASWSYDYWMTNRLNQLHNIADWLAEESAKTGIPLVKISDPNGRGVIYHSNLGSTGCGHSDPGSGWPINEVLAWAKGGVTETPAPITEESDVSSAVAFYEGKDYYAYINPGGKVCMNGSPVDSGSNAKGGVGLAINPDTGRKIISYTNQSGHLCIYYQDEGSSKWVWADKGISAK